MADKKVSALPSAAPATGGEEIHVNDSGVDGKLDIDDLKTYISPTGLRGSTDGNLMRRCLVGIEKVGATTTGTVKLVMLADSLAGRRFNCGSIVSSIQSSGIGKSGSTTVGTGGVDQIAFTLSANGSVVTFELTGASKIISNALFAGLGDYSGGLASAWAQAISGKFSLQLFASGGGILDLLILNDGETATFNCGWVEGGAA